MNKLRYKDGKGDHRGFVTFLDQSKLQGLRYCGNHLHMLFYNAVILIERQDAFAKLLKVGTTLGGLRSRLEKDFNNEVTLCELRMCHRGCWMMNSLHTMDWYSTTTSCMQPRNAGSHIGQSRRNWMMHQNIRCPCMLWPCTRT